MADQKKHKWNVDQDLKNMLHSLTAKGIMSIKEWHYGQSLCDKKIKSEIPGKLFHNGTQNCTVLTFSLFSVYLACS